MHAVAINGSPRKAWNTATLLRHAAQGVQSAGGTVETIHLYELSYRGCTSCFACKRKENGTAGACAMRDDLTPVLEQVLSADILLLGSPIYLGNVTGMARSFTERLLFPNISYDTFNKRIHDYNINTVFFYTMNLPAQGATHYRSLLATNTELFSRLGGSTEYYACYDTWQFDDYDKYNSALFDTAAKRLQREEQFPKDCKRAFEIGARLAGKDKK